jgi:periplasmic divalent cation tolerance protein
MQNSSCSKKKLILLYITCPDERIADLISNELVSNQLAACTNSLAGMKSHYWWEGKVETACESVLIVKTTKELSGQCQSIILKHHPYTLPCILELEVTGGLPAYLNWLVEVTLVQDSKEP